MYDNMGSERRMTGTGHVRDAPLHFAPGRYHRAVTVSVAPASTSHGSTARASPPEGRRPPFVGLRTIECTTYIATSGAYFRAFSSSFAVTRTDVGPRVVPFTSTR